MNQTLLEEIIAACRIYTKNGTPASYIPALAQADPSRLGICVADDRGLLIAGDAEMRFSIQSISKVLVFTSALMDGGADRVLQKVSIEPTADSFNSIISLETRNFNKPLNPMINAGAIACLTLTEGDTSAQKVERILGFARQVADNDNIDIDEEIYRSEKATGSRNRALAYYMKSTGVIDGDVEELLDAYFRICAIRMDCVDLAKTALCYAKDGTDIFPGRIARVVKATMTMCGMYDESGRVAVAVGLPTKSGVGGGILSVKPGQMGIGIYGPALNEKGSSVAGIAALEMLSNKLGLSIF